MGTFNMVPTTYTQIASEPSIQYKRASKINYLTSQKVERSKDLTSEKVERPMDTPTRRPSVVSLHPTYSLPTPFSRVYSQPLIAMPPMVVYPTTTTTTTNTVAPTDTTTT